MPRAFKQAEVSLKTGYGLPPQQAEWILKQAEQGFDL